MSTHTYIFSSINLDIRNKQRATYSEKKRCLPEPFCGFCDRVKDRTLKKVLPKSGFSEKPTEPFIILYQKWFSLKGFRNKLTEPSIILYKKRFSLTQKVPHINGFS